jgi:hypothetical protein
MTLSIAALTLILVQQEQDWNARADALAEGLGEELSALRDALKSPEGRIVLRDRAEKAAAELRRRAEKEALAEFFTRGFDADQRRDFIECFRVYQADLQVILPTLREIREKLVSEPAANRHLSKFLSHDLGPALVYLEAIAPKARPRPEAFLKKLGAFIVLDEDGRYRVAEPRMEEFKSIAEKARRKVAALDRIFKSLSEFGPRIAPADDFHKKLREAASDRLFTSILLAKALKKDDPDEIEKAADKVADRIEEAFDETREGRVLREENVGEIEKVLENYQLARRALQTLRPCAHKIAEKMRKGNEVDEMFAGLLREDFVILLISAEAAPMAADPSRALQAALGDAVVKTEDGRYRVSENAQDQISRHLPRILREAQRRAEALAPHADRTDDVEVREILRTPYGAWHVEQIIRADLATRKFDGLSAWVDAHFENRSLKPGSKGEIESFLRDVERIRQEGQDGSRD